MAKHPDVRAPARKELHMWTPVLHTERFCVDKPSCDVFNREKRGQAPAWPLSKEVAGKLIESYLSNFPRIDPREYAVTGEATPAYVYSASSLLMMQESIKAISAHITELPKFSADERRKLVACS
ncbi:MAG: hypothetical protein SGPRY_006469 [Prymnesium sp.]